MMPGMRICCVIPDQRGDLELGAKYTVFETYWNGHVVTVSKWGRWFNAERFKPVEGAR